MTNDRVFFLFLAYSFVGYIAEVLYCSLREHRFINRGFLLGPVCPIYGFGAILVIYLLLPWRDTYARLFFATVIITSILEYVSSFILEKLFKTKWWDYSTYKFNINGRVCLQNSLLFGVMGVLCVHFLHPIIMKLIFLLSNTQATWIARFLFAISLCDLCWTLHRLLDFNEVTTKLREQAQIWKEHYEKESWFHGENFATMLQSLQDKVKRDKTEFNQKFILRLNQATQRHKELELWLKKFPSMKSLHNDIIIEHIRMQVYKRKMQKASR